MQADLSLLLKQLREEVEKLEVEEDDLDPESPEPPSGEGILRARLQRQVARQKREI